VWLVRRLRLPLPLLGVTAPGVRLKPSRGTGGGSTVAGSGPGCLCGGGGDRDPFVRAAGSGYRAETSVGKFRLENNDRGRWDPAVTLVRLATGSGDYLPTVSGRLGFWVRHDEGGKRCVL
jgi:hypothetical protein